MKTMFYMSLWARILIWFGLMPRKGVWLPYALRQGYADHDLLAKAALMDWLTWVEMGARPVWRGIDRADSLCFMLNKLLEINRVPREQLYKICNTFSDRLGTTFPFNVDSYTFHQERRLGTMHTNPQRLKWAREHIGEYNVTQCYDFVQKNMRKRG